MPLTDSQKALLQLFLEGGQDYAQAAAWLDLERDGAANRARDAVEALSPGSPALPPSVGDWLLGQADTIAEADAIAAVRRDPDLRRRAVAVASGMRLVFPEAHIPDVPPSDSSSPPLSSPSTSERQARAEPSRPTTPAVPPPEVEPASRPASGRGGTEGFRPPSANKEAGSLSAGVAARVGSTTRAIRQKPRFAILAGASIVLLIAVVLGVTLLGGDETDQAGSEGNGTATLVPLAPVDDRGKSTGQAVVVAANDAAIVQLSANGLAPTGAGESYVLWLYRNPEQAYPLARDAVGDSGKLTGPAPVPRGLDPSYGTYGCLELTLASSDEIEAALKRVAKSGTGPSVGSIVLRGEISPASRDPRSGSASVCDPDARDS
ncbi:MAG: hypothetical protein ACKOBH_08035 [bacterium]